MEDLKKIASSEISNPPAPALYGKIDATHSRATFSSDSLLGVEDHGQHLLGKVSLALEKNDSSHSASGIEMHFGPVGLLLASSGDDDATAPAPIL
ncbi:hypothetical protein Nepgr_020412 [Nepenthes gracilis]|uniref:Uncharacterized protein n=1 Tax=Nepenthes gracilis TaxID=150966 RepID=A0AAD3XWC1_NEPGR|nr:hypothetical protein Nepgr_020412 [Nepenthes gracilis]